MRLSHLIASSVLALSLSGPGGTPSLAFGADHALGLMQGERAPAFAQVAVHADGSIKGTLHTEAIASHHGSAAAGSAVTASMQEEHHANAAIPGGFIERREAAANQGAKHTVELAKVPIASFVEHYGESTGTSLAQKLSETTRRFASLVSLGAVQYRQGHATNTAGAESSGAQRRAMIQLDTLARMHETANKFVDSSGFSALVLQADAHLRSGTGSHEQQAPEECDCKLHDECRPDSVCTTLEVMFGMMLLTLLTLLCGAVVWVWMSCAKLPPKRRSIPDPEASREHMSAALLGPPKEPVVTFSPDVTPRAAGERSESEASETTTWLKKEDPTGFTAVLSRAANSLERHLGGSRRPTLTKGPGEFAEDREASPSGRDHSPKHQQGQDHASGSRSNSGRRQPEPLLQQTRAQESPKEGSAADVSNSDSDIVTPKAKARRQSTLKSALKTNASADPSPANRASDTQGVGSGAAPSHPGAQ